MIFITNKNNYQFLSKFPLCVYIFKMQSSFIIYLKNVHTYLHTGISSDDQQEFPYQSKAPNIFYDKNYSSIWFTYHFVIMRIRLSTKYEGICLRYERLKLIVGWIHINRFNL